MKNRYEQPTITNLSEPSTNGAMPVAEAQSYGASANFGDHSMRSVDVITRNPHIDAANERARENGEPIKEYPGMHLAIGEFRIVPHPRTFGHLTLVAGGIVQSYNSKRAS